MLETSILTSIKKLLGLPKEYTPFDQDVMMFINSAFSDLNSLGVGPNTAFVIEDDQATWARFIGDNSNLENVKLYIYMSVKIAFDPPQNSAVLTAYQERRREAEFRLSVAADEIRSSIAANAELSSVTSDISFAAPNLTSSNSEASSETVAEAEEPIVYFTGDRNG